MEAKRIKKEKRPKITINHDNIKNPLKIKDIQELVLWIFGEGINPRWMFVQNKSLIEKIVVFWIPGIDAHELLSRCGTEKCIDLHYPHPQVFDLSEGNLNIREFMPFTCSLFKECVLVKAPGEKGVIQSPFRAFMNIPVKRNKKIQLPCRIEDLVMDESELKMHNYPLSLDLFPEFLLTTATSSYSMLAVDCEMCSTKEGLELTRVSIVDAMKNVVYDKLVKPSNPIINYNTQFSGITEEMLRSVENTLQSVQSDILNIIGSNTILMGHSLENDLKALGIIHKRVIDTALLFSHKSGTLYKPSLRWLTSSYLKQTIQSSHEGHCSIEDAKAVVDLVTLKASKGMNFGRNEFDSISTAFMDKKSIVIEKEDYDFSLLKENDFIVIKSGKIDDFNETSVGSQRDVIKQIDAEIESIYNSLPNNSLFLVCSPVGNRKEFSRLIELKQDKDSWTMMNQMTLESEAMKARVGVLFSKIKRE